MLNQHFSIRSLLTSGRRPRLRAALGAVLAALALSVAGPAPSAGALAAAGGGSTGWVRLAHLSPNTPAVDVYLYPYGNATAQLVLKHVAYGDVSPYQPLKPGLYLVAMRGAGAAASSSPVISTDVTVVAGDAYTVAGLGPAAALTLKVLDDQLDAPKGRAGVRLIQASLRSPTVTVTAGSGTIATDLRFPAVTDYEAVQPGAWPVRIATDTASSVSQITLDANDTYTFAVLDGTGAAPRLLNLTDAGGTSVVPAGGVAAGFGGTAVQTGASGSGSGSGVSLFGYAGWSALLLLGAGGALLAAKRLRRG
jgi:hypothetical protein